MADFSDLPLDEEPRPRRRARGHSPWPAVGLMFAILVFFGGVGTAVYFAVRDVAGAKPPAAAQAAPQESPPPEPVKPKPKAKPPAVVVSPPPPKPKVWTFKEAWAEAAAAVKGLEADEPARTAAAMKILTGGELADAQTLTEYAASGADLDTRSVRRLQYLGLSDWLHVWSAKKAVNDATCREMAQAFWDREKPIESLLYIMQVWFTADDVTRIHATAAVRAQIPTKEMTPFDRDAVLLLGGRKWLSR